MNYTKKCNLKQKINEIKSKLHNELDIAEECYKNLDFTTEFPLLVSYTTRIKILKTFINWFKLIKYNKLDEINIESITKRINIHLYQIKKLTNNKNYLINKNYFSDIIKLILYIINSKNKSK